MTSSQMFFPLPLSLIAGLSLSRKVQRNVQRVILKRMQEMHDAGNDEVKPNVVTFNSVINAWSNSGEKDAPRRAEALLQRMHRPRRVDG